MKNLPSLITYVGNFVTISKEMRVIVILTTFLSMANAADKSDLYTASDLASIGQRLGQKRERFASQDLKRYGNHYTMVAYREGTGSSEIHQKEVDIFVIEKGECSIILGGKMVGGHETKPGELRGNSIDGGEKFSLKTGDILHIPAGVAHQMLITQGKPVTYFVIKVTGQ